MHYHAIRSSRCPSEPGDDHNDHTQPCLDGTESGVTEPMRASASAKGEHESPIASDDGDDVWRARMRELRAVAAKTNREGGPIGALDELTAGPAGHSPVRSVLSTSTGTSIETAAEAGSSDAAPAPALAPAPAPEQGLELDAKQDSAMPSSASSNQSALTVASIDSLDTCYQPPIAYNAWGEPHEEVDDTGTAATYSEAPFLPTPLPFSAESNSVPFAYQRALRNRILDVEFRPGWKYDIIAYTPVFVHDILMLPGSLAAVREKGSAEDLINRITPALLPSFTAHIHTTAPQTPILLPSPNPGAHVRGLLVFGQSRSSRRRIHEHYRPHCKRIKVEVEFDSAYMIPAYWRKGGGEDDRWELRRRRVWAYAWIGTDAQDADAMRSAREPDGPCEGGWKLEEYLAGKYEPEQRGLRIEPARWLGPKRVAGEGVPTDDEDEVEAESKVVPITDWDHDELTNDRAWEEGNSGGYVIEWKDCRGLRVTEGVDDPEDESNGIHLMELSIDGEVARGWVNSGGAEGRDGDQDKGGEDEISTTALNRDYERKGEAGCW